MLGSSGWAMGRTLHKRNSGIRKKLYWKFWSKMNMRGTWRHPLHVREKETAMCRDHVDGTVVHVFREIMPECVLKLVRGFYQNHTRHSIPARTQLVVKVGDVFFSASVIACLHLSRIP